MDRRITTEKCPTCGHEVTHIDPPLVFDVKESCNATREIANNTVHCINSENHPTDQPHYDLVEKMYYWTDDGETWEDDMIPPYWM